jgi:glucose-1-phosphate cytidylyltransferase
MKVVILAGGLGSRLSEETYMKPKPMIKIGNKPMIHHIMQIYSNHNIKEFIICCGYKGYVIKKYFDRFFLKNIKKKLKNNILRYQFRDEDNHNLKVTLVDTGKNTMTGGRLKRVSKLLKNEKQFCFTYGDGVGNIDVTKLINFHKKHKKLASLTACRPQARYGALTFGQGDLVTRFVEKPEGDGSWINGGFFVLNTSVIKYIKNDQTSWEGEPLKELSKKKQLYAYKHYGFWMPMDTLRDKNQLNLLWKIGKAPWKNIK